MDIQPLNGILNDIGSGGEWDEQRQLQRLISQWEAIVGGTVAQHSCPLEVRNGVLQVATSTAIWAQNLSFERRRILKKLNQRAHFKILGLKEIRFSTAQWHNRPGSSGAITVDKRLNSYQQQMQWQQHPSRLPPPADERPHSELAESAPQAFERWSQRRQQQINQVPPCPQCQTPTPEGELQRWGVCAFCMTQQWQAEKDATQPDGSEEAENWQKGPPSTLTVEEARQARAVSSKSASSNSNVGDPETSLQLNRDRDSGNQGNDDQANDDQDHGDQANDDRDHSTPNAQTSPSPVNGAMFQRLQNKLSSSSPQPLSQRKPSHAPPRPLQPWTGLPPVAWPSSPAPPETAPQSALDSDSSQPDSTSRPDLGSPNSALPQQTSLQSRNDAKPASLPGLSQDPASTGPLAPLQRTELEAARTTEESLPEQSDNPPGAQQQAAWAQAFQSLKSQEEQRQQQQAELERRTAARIRQMRGDRETKYLSDFSNTASEATPSPSTTPSKDKKKEVLKQTGHLSSGRSKPVLKKKL